MKFDKNELEIIHHVLTNVYYEIQHCMETEEDTVWRYGHLHGKLGRILERIELELGY